MKANKIKHTNRGTLLIAAVIVLSGLGLAAVLAFDKLQEIYHEQCVIHNPEKQVFITSGKMVRADVIAEHLGLGPGANLATIDFDRKREELLARVPNLRAVRISRHLPDKVVITTEERTPIARIIARGNKTDIGRVVDTEGVVFIWQRGTQVLPVIRESILTPKGERIQGRTLAALRLIEAAREPELQELNVLEVDTLKRDFLTATLGNYSRLKILWEGMDEAKSGSRDDLVRRLTLLRDTIRTQVAPTAAIWNATVPNRIFADLQEKF